MQTCRTKVDVVLVSYNSSEIIKSALYGLPNWANIIVIDNASSDGIADTLKGMPVDLSILDKNYGFGTACNRGAERGSAPYILFLNPDAQIRPDAIQHLISKLEQEERWGAISPKICYADGTEFFRGPSFFEPHLGAPSKSDTAAEVYVLSGSVFLCKRDIFEELGGFDENIFLFMEDDDLSYRLRQAGYKLIADRRVTAIHLHGQSSGSNSKLEEFKAYEAERSRIYTAQKHGISYDTNAQIKKTKFRLIRAIAFLDRKRIARCKGRLRALEDKT